MGKRAKIITVKNSILTLAVFVFLLFFQGKTYQEVVQTQDNSQIQAVIKQSYILEAAAGKTFDISSFNQVFINDPRGGDLSSSTIDFVNSVFQYEIEGDLGYLDYKKAYYTWWKNGAIKYESLQQNAENENRILTTAELLSLVDEDGRIPLQRLQGDISLPELVFISIEIHDDLAFVVFDDGPRTNKMTLVKIENDWFIAGNKFLSIHP
jgi:hypothetical protein